MLEWLSELFAPAVHGKRVRARIRGFDVVAISAVADGDRACIAGVVEMASPQVAPLSHEACAGWVVSFEETGAADARFAGTADSGNELRVVDSTGVAIVMLGGARIDLPVTYSQRYVTHFSLTAGEAELYRRAKVRLNYPDSSGIRINEHAIFPGMRMHVVGNIHREPDRDAIDGDRAGYRSEMPTRPVLSGARRAPLLVRVP